MLEPTGDTHTCHRTARVLRARAAITRVRREEHTQEGRRGSDRIVTSPDGFVLWPAWIACMCGSMLCHVS